MSKVVTLSIAVVLLIGSSALGLGAIDQIQDTTIGLTNAIDLIHGHQDGHAQQNLCLDAQQYGDKVCGAWARERLLGNFIQVGDAWGDCAVVGLMQTVAGMSSQAQFIGDCVEPKMEAQTLNLLAGQVLMKSDGPGGAVANHVIVLQEDQQAANPAGGMRESTNVVGLQDSYLEGSACAAGMVSSTMNVATVQSQSSM